MSNAAWHFFSASWFCDRNRSLLGMSGIHMKCGQLARAGERRRGRTTITSLWRMFPQGWSRSDAIAAGVPAEVKSGRRLLRLAS